LVDPVCEVVHFEGGGSGRFAGLFSASRESDAIGLERHPGSVRTGIHGGSSSIFVKAIWCDNWPLHRTQFRRKVMANSLTGVLGVHARL
jgi:hypothetical protein